MKIGITGSEGLIGWHQQAYLKALGQEYEIRLANRAIFEEPELLEKFAQGLDVVLHFAGMNRGDEAEVEAVNPALAQALVTACEQANTAPFLIFANTTHIERNTAYGRGKRASAEILRSWTNRQGSGFANIILPHVFGEFGKPFYNSVVSTFCHQLAESEAPHIIEDGDLELAHAQDVAAFCFKAAQKRQIGDFRLRGEPIKVSMLLELLLGMQKSYASMIMPLLDTPLKVRLFNTLRSYLFPTHYPVTLKLHSDARGNLFEAIKSHGGGQVYLSHTHPGITRGNHFHTRKVERFLVIGGEGEIRLRKLFGKDILRFKVSGDAPAYIDIPTFYTHDITNSGPGDLMTLFWANEIFDPNDTDTIPEPVDIL